MPFSSTPLSDPVFVVYKTARVKGFDMGSEGSWFFLNNTTVQKLTVRL